MEEENEAKLAEEKKDEEKKEEKEKSPAKEKETILNQNCRIHSTKILSCIFIAILNFSTPR